MDGLVLAIIDDSPILTERRSCAMHQRKQQGWWNERSEQDCYVSL